MDHLWLDLRPVGRERLEKQFPTILGRCRELGLEPTGAPIPVAPAAHYWMGGISTDLNAATTLPGLYAVGEVACTGVHGANRLASNSLMECLVFARRLAQLPLPPSAPHEEHQEPCRPLAVAGRRAADLETAIDALRQLCWQAAGVERQGSDLAHALRQVQQQRQELEGEALLQHCHGLEPGHQLQLEGPRLAELQLSQNLRQRLVLAELLIEAALFRGESRGGHHRVDAPAPQPFWRRHSLQQRGHAIGTAAVQDAAQG